MNKKTDQKSTRMKKQSNLERTVAIESCPALYYTAEDAAVGKNGAGYTESEETVHHKMVERKTKPYG